MTFIRHLFAVLALPFTVTVIIPVYVFRRYGVTFRPDAWWIAASIPPFAVGLALFVSSLSLFARKGRGTLAPWDPPRHLVVSGPYRYVRNPMISGVIFILIAEAVLLQSRPHAWWAAIFTIINLIYIPLLEEPMLEARFGEEYREYCRNVRGLIPRIRPWTGAQGAFDRTEIP